MDIRGLMQFSGASIKTLTFTPAEKDPTASLTLTARMTPELANTMRCLEALYHQVESGGWAPHNPITRTDLGEAKLRDIDLCLPSPTSPGAFDVFRPELIYSFKFDREDEKDPVWTIQMLVRIKNRVVDLAAFFEGLNKDTFEFAIRSLQQEFDWSGKGGTGVRVAPTENQNVRAGKAEENGPLFQQPEAECIHCQHGVSINADGMHMLEDGLAECARKPVPEGEQPSGPRCAFCDRGDTPSEDGFHALATGPRRCGKVTDISDMSNAAPIPDEPTRGPVLVDARDMGQRRQKKQRTRGELSQPTPEELQASVQVLEDELIPETVQ